MIPWPIAALTLFYGILATLAASGVWRMVAASGGGPAPWWMLGWFLATASATCGLPLLRPWARVLAVWISIWIGVVTMAYAALLVRAGQPGLGLAASISTVVQWIIVRYLQRPAVKAWFRPNAAES